MITIACPAGPSHYALLPLDKISPHIDFFNLMAYDFAGSWDSTSGHQANLFRSTAKPSSTKFNADEAINYYLSHGVKPEKLVLGMPLYGRAFLNTNGPGEAYNGVGAADFSQGSWEAGVWDFKSLPRPGAAEKFDGQSVASYSYDANTRMMVSYDNIECAKRKAAYLKEKKLGGAMWWETSGDRTGDGSLVAAVVGELGGVERGLEQRENWLEYKQSRFDNIRMGCPGE